MPIMAWTNERGRIDGRTVTCLGSSSWWDVLLAARDTAGRRYFEVELLGGADSGGSLKMGYFIPDLNELRGSCWYRDDYRGGCYAVPGGGVSCPGYASTGVVRLMCAVDLDAKKIWFGNGGVWVNGGDPASGAAPQYANLAFGGYPGVSLIGTMSARFVPPAEFQHCPVGFSAFTELPLVGRAALAQRSAGVDGGPYHIIEPVTRLNAVPPQPRRSRLCDQITGRVVREVWSDPVTGLITFSWIRQGPWILYALDHTGEFEAVIVADRLATLTGARP